MTGDLWLECDRRRIEARGSINSCASGCPQYSRSRLQDWIEQGRVLVNGSPEKRSYLLKGAERIHVQPGELPPLRATPGRPAARGAV